MNKSDDYLLCGGKIITENGMLTDRAIVVKSGFIQSIISINSTKINLENIQQIEIDKEFFVLPGFIDMHIHGSQNADVMDARESSLVTISESLFKQGVTSFLATTMTDDKNHISEVLRTITNYKKNLKNSMVANLHGVHLEGPFISSKRLGAHSRRWQTQASVELFKKWQTIAKGKIKQVTIAPEVDKNFELIRYLQKNKIIASIGHTSCSSSLATKSIAAGITNCTHLFNAMSGLSHRNTGAVSAVLFDDNITCELIVDGVHLSPEIVRLAYKIKGEDKIILVTDAMRGQGIGDGKFALGDNQVFVVGNEARLADGTLAGSILTMQEALKNIINFTGCDIVAAAIMASTNPAKKLNLQNLGSIAVGKKANFTILNNNFKVVKTFS